MEIHYRLCVRDTIHSFGPCDRIGDVTAGSVTCTEIYTLYRSLQPPATGDGDENCVVPKQPAFEFQLRFSFYPELISPVGIKHFPEANGSSCAAKCMAVWQGMRLLWLC